MAKVVYNVGYGGASLSKKAIALGEKLDPSFTWSSKHLGDVEDANGVRIARHHPILVQIVEQLGKAASGVDSNLRVEEFEGNMYYIDDYDGAETVITLADMVRIR